ncbi:MAG: tetratricopeptide repeat protein [Candidatus Latescibacteria bacterium]|nr:tetratricopeptide repeat protein [Candidatus Latescibacterota bacterium]
MRKIWYLIVVLIFFTGPGPVSARSSKPDTTALKPVNREAMGYLISAKVKELQQQYARAAEDLERAVALDSTSATLYRALAENHLRANNSKAALAAARRAVALNSTSGELHRLLFETLRSAGDDSAAAVELESILTLDPQDMNAYARLSEIYQRTGQRARLISLLDRLRRVPDLSPNTRLIIVRQYAEIEAFDRAEEECRAILKENPGVEQAWHVLTLVQMARKDTAGAAQTCRQAVTHVGFRENGPIQPLLPILYRAPALLEPALRETPPDTAFLFTLGRSFLSARLFREAAQTLDRVVSVPQPSAEQWITDASAHLALGDLQRSVEILQKANGLFPNNGDVLYHMGRTLIGAGKLDEAAAAFQKALALAPDNLGYRFGMGLVQQRQKQWAEAIQTFRVLAEKAPKDTPLYVDALFSLGSSLERAGRFDESVTTFQKLINLVPQHAEALNYLGYMFAEKGIQSRLEEAEGLVNRALAIDPDNGAFLDSLGWTYYQLGRHKEAGELLDRAIQAELRRKADGESISVIYDHIGDNAQKLGNIDKALDAWKKALDAKPGDKKIEAKRNALMKSSQKP